MQALVNQLQAPIKEVLKSLYAIELNEVDLSPTRKEFEGDLTLVVFPFLKQSRKKPEATATEIGEALRSASGLIAGFNVVKGFLNLTIAEDYWREALSSFSPDPVRGMSDAPTTLVEYSSPNTNKPLHLGHIRNILLGYSVAEILAAAGHTVKKVQIVNDRGIHICKSMLAWQKFGAGETPESSGLKGDHLIGKYYVEFDKAFKEEIKANNWSEEEALEKSSLMQEARKMLQDWENGEPEVVALWEKMNSWVYAGFDQTYQRLGVDFDQNYYESDTYLLGKKEVEAGLEAGVFYRKEDGSVWCDLEEEKLGQKLLLRKDGTSVYMTQDIGTAIQRYRDFTMDGMIYTVGNEQDHHFKVLFAILKKLGYDWAKQLYHLSYGMVDLPSGKMKSREGTVVDADDLIDEMEATARAISEELGKTEGMSETEKKELFHMVGLGALKYFILRVDPRKRMLFDPKESIDFQGDTGPFIQYTHARIKSLLRKAESLNLSEAQADQYHYWHLREKELLKHLLAYSDVVQEAAREHAPSLVASYCYDLVKLYNALYQQLPILNDADASAVAFRLQLSKQTAAAVKRGMSLLGIGVPERM
jgi:arginyl-tRNA synthetase